MPLFIYHFLSQVLTAIVRRKVKVKRKDEEPEEEVEKPGMWVTTYPYGEKLQTKADGSMEELKPVMICQASDPQTNQVIASIRRRHMYSSECGHYVLKMQGWLYIDIIIL